jgi:hypothetical protein
MKWAACLGGALILAAVTHVNVVATGGYGTPHSYLAMAIAAGVALGAVIVGVAWSERRRGIAMLLVAAICAGEAFGLVATAERLIASREAAQAPLRLLADERTEAEGRVAQAMARLASLPAETARLAHALESNANSAQAIVHKSAERGCAENCRKLLQAQADASAREVDEARAEIVQQRSQAEAELREARLALSSIRPPTSATPLADRVGWPAWAVDLLQSALGSIAANGLACALLAFGGHRNKAIAEPRSIGEQTLHRPERLARRTRNADPHVDHAATFAVARLAPASDGTADLADVYRAYLDWCKAKGMTPLPQRDIGGALLTLFKRAHLPVALVDGRRLVQGAVLRDDG